MTDLSRLNLTAVIDVEQAIEVMLNAGPQAFAVYFINQAAKEHPITVWDLALLTGLSTEDVKNACYHLGLNMLNIRDDLH